MIDAAALNRAAGRHRGAMIRFARDLVAIPSFSCGEGRLVKRIAVEMRRNGFDPVRVDAMGNIVGVMGRGRTKVMVDAHIDTVGIGDPKAWKWDPFKGKLEKGAIWGRGASDQKLSMVSMVYAGRLIKDLGLAGDYTYWAVGSCQEEDCDGLPLLHLIKREGFRPDYVVITEPTDLAVYRGHRGRMEMKVVAAGRSCHASAPERGINAVANMAEVVREIGALNGRLKKDAFLGKGTIAVTKIECQTPSLNAVPDECTIYLDRRLTIGETLKSAVAEVARLPSVRRHKARVSVLEYKALSWKGLKVGQEKYYPTWKLPEDHCLLKAAVKAGAAALGRPPRVGKWVFSTNGVASMGRLGIPTVGFGPSNEVWAHTVDERMPVDHLVKASVFYAAIMRYLSGDEKL